MARMSISIPDQLRERMTPYDNRVNWSNVAQTAFEAEVLKYKLPESPSMQDVIDRLRKSKLTAKPQAWEIGRLAGQEWAMKVADYKHLESINRINEEMMLNIDRLAEFLLNFAFPGEDVLKTPMFRPSMPGLPEDEWVLGFIRGAKQVWDEVADKL